MTYSNPTPDTTRLHLAALQAGDRAVWPGTRFTVDRHGEARVMQPRPRPRPLVVPVSLPPVTYQVRHG